MFSKKFTISIVLVSLILMVICSSCHRKKVRHHSNQKKRCGPRMVWVPSHYTPSGIWIKGHCAHK